MRKIPLLGAGLAAVLLAVMALAVAAGATAQETPAPTAYSSPTPLEAGALETPDAGTATPAADETPAEPPASAPNLGSGPGSGPTSTLPWTIVGLAAIGLTAITTAGLIARRQ